MESSPITSKVVEYRERNLRPLLFAKSLQIILRWPWQKLDLVIK